MRELWGAHRSWVGVLQLLSQGVCGRAARTEVPGLRRGERGGLDGLRALPRSDGALVHLLWRSVTAGRSGVPSLPRGVCGR